MESIQKRGIHKVPHRFYFSRSGPAARYRLVAGHAEVKGIDSTAALRVARCKVEHSIRWPEDSDNIIHDDRDVAGRAEVKGIDSTAALRVARCKVEHSG